MLADAEGLHTSSTIVWDRAAVETPFPRVVNGTLYVFYSARGVESDGHTEFAGAGEKAPALGGAIAEWFVDEQGDLRFEQRLNRR